MSEALNAAEKAIYEALRDGAPVWPVFQHVPQDTALPLNIIGDMDENSFAVKSDDDARINLQILTVYQGEERKSVTDEQARIYATLNEVTLSEGGFNITCYRTSSRAELLEDGETYLGTSFFTVLALAA
ncbi:MAG: hypothetical protein ABJP02_04890 [Parasphingorhabdus sp.]|uniref:hypothetical protein n=1 Tax=Parasphingorhabdus sp. TaxID=2709688 RepID=UPI0032980B62